MRERERNRTRGGGGRGRGRLHCPLTTAPLSGLSAGRNRTWKCVILPRMCVFLMRPRARQRPWCDTAYKKVYKSNTGLPLRCAVHTHMHGISMLILGLVPHLALCLIFLQERRPVTVGWPPLRAGRDAAPRTFGLIIQNVVLLRTQAWGG